MLAVDNDRLLHAIRELKPDPAVAARYVLPDLLAENFGALSSIQREHSLLQFAFSIKTNPSPAVLTAARAAGCYAEAISGGELAIARATGFGHIVYNGPLPAWRSGAEPPTIAFADSVEAFAENSRRLPQTVSAIRVRPTGVTSRFGIPREDFAQLVEAVRASGRRETGCSFHVRPEDYGPGGWRSLAEDAVAFARELESATGIAVVVFDVGGGHAPAEFDRAIEAGDFSWLSGQVRRSIPSVSQIIAEPGQAVATPCECVVGPVVEDRRRHGRREVVIDAGYPDFTQLTTFEHRFFALTGDTVVNLEKGSDRILGRTCLEYDVVAENVRLPARFDAIVVGDTGAYDHSMSFNFARGGNSEHGSWQRRTS